MGANGYKLEPRRTPTPRPGNEPVAAAISADRPAAALCRGCSYWLTRVGPDVKCPECGGLTELSLAPDWVGAADEEFVDGVRVCWRVAAIGLVVGIIFLLLLMGVA